MGKTQSEVNKAGTEFYHWLSAREDEGTVLDLYTVLPAISNYGKKLKFYKQSLFELDDTHLIGSLLEIMLNDKSFKFMHMGNMKKIQQMLQSYLEYVKEKTIISEKKKPVSKAEKKEPLTWDGLGRTTPGSNNGTTGPRRSGNVKLYTKQDMVYIGKTPAEALASMCERLAKSNPEGFSELIGKRYYGYGSIVLFEDEPQNGGAIIHNASCYLDNTLSTEAALNYGKWLCTQCFEKDLPSHFSITEKTVIKQEEKKEENIINSNTTTTGETKGKDEKERKPVEAKETYQLKSSSREWSMHEVALLIDTYFKTTPNGHMRGAAEALSHSLREMAVKSGKKIDATYRNVNGIIMQLGAVQYCVTAGKKGLSNVSIQIRAMVDMYQKRPAEFNKILQEAIKSIGDPACEIYQLFEADEYELLRNELIKQDIKTIKQLKALNLWSFLNEHNLYDYDKRQKIFSQVHAMLKLPEEKKKKTYCLKTKKGICYHGNSPAETLAAYCEGLIQKYPQKMQNLIGKRYNGIGLIVLCPQMPLAGGVKLLNLQAYIDNSLLDKTALGYGVWLCHNCGEMDEPISFVESEEKRIIETKGKEKERVIQEEKPVEKTEEKAIEITREEKQQPKDGKKMPTAKEMTESKDEEVETWLFYNLSLMGIDYEDKRNNQGCLWISGDHKLDHFIGQCAEKGYNFTYKADGYKSLSKGPVWWTKDYYPAEKDTSSNGKTEETKTSLANFRSWLEEDFRSYMIQKFKLATGTVSQYCQSIQAIEQFLRNNYIPLSLIDSNAAESQEIRRKLEANQAFIEWNRKGHYQYSAALGHYIQFLKLCESKKENEQNTITVREAVIRVLTNSNKPLTASEIYSEIIKKHLYSFNTNNPVTIIEHAIRRACKGVQRPDHIKEDVFGMSDGTKGIHYYLLMKKDQEQKKADKTEQKDTTKENQWECLLEKYFPDGFILNDFLSQLQAKAYWQELFKESCPLDGGDIDDAMKSIGTVHDGRVFIRNEEENDLIASICIEISNLLDEYTSVYRKCIYDRYQEQLARYSIYKENVMEEQLLKKAQNSFYCSWQIFMRKGQEPSVMLDCRKVLRDHGGAMHVTDVQKILWFIPKDTVYHALSIDKEALNIGKSTWMLAEHFPLTSIDADKIADVLDEYFISNDYIQAENLLSLLQDKLPSIAENLQGLHFSAIFNIVRYHLEDRFSYTKAIISPKGSKIDFTLLFRTFAAQHDHFTLDELTAFAKEMKNPIYWESIFSGGAIRISKTELVTKSKVKFDVEKTDKMLEDICTGDYMPLYSVTPAMMMHLPPCGYQWNGYLLLNYVYSFSKIFRVSYKSIGKTGYYGAMIRRDCETISNYEQLLVRFLTDDDTWHTVDDACELIVKKGLQAAKDIGGIEKIVSQAKKNKLEKGE